VVSKRRLVAVAIVALAVVHASVAVAAGAEPPPPTDPELSQFIAVTDGLAGDSARAAEFCVLLAEEKARENDRDEDIETLGRRIEAHPVLGPHLREQGLSGRRYVELSVQVAGVLLGAAIADEADAAARAKGEAGGNRDVLLASSPAAAPILARQQDLTRALTGLEELCGDGEEDDSEEYDEEPTEEDGESADRP